ncbi:hypothetical protein EG327_006899 [Venturia inaequalis]|uniref:Uncharacterized protein n=1 Tax=Venturia inaequalis TaxID=5025 RepID=A0A8H3Z4T7_VENIN|nr:hypothetical protein EG327_006899 [Venturia inaequalis]
MSPMVQGYSTNYNTSVTNEGPTKDEDFAEDPDQSMTDVTEELEEDGTALELQSDDKLAFISLLKSYQTPQALAEKIASLFDIEDALEQRRLLIQTKAFTGELPIEDLISEEIARLRSVVRKIQRLKLLRATGDEVFIFDSIRAVWRSLEKIKRDNGGVVVTVALENINELRFFSNFISFLAHESGSGTDSDKDPDDELDDSGDEEDNEEDLEIEERITQMIDSMYGEPSQPIKVHPTYLASTQADSV